MICYMCGRELNDDAVICRGCGAQQRRAAKVRRDKVSATMKNPVAVGKSSMKVWHICLCLFLLVTVLIVAYVVYPDISAFISEATADDGEAPSLVVDSAASEIDKVSGEILVLNSKIADCVVQSEKAYDDNSWEKTFLVNGCITVRTLRYAQSEQNADWINAYIYPLYPDINSVSEVSPAPSYSDCTSVRIRIAQTSYASGCMVEAVLVRTEKFDHIFIVEMPNELFDEYEIWINEWVDSLEVVDADIHNNTENL